MRAQLALLIMLCLTMMLFLSQQALTAVASEEGVTSTKIYDEPELFKTYNLADNGNYSLNMDINSSLPSSSPSILQDLQAFIFPLQVFLNWLLSTPALILAFLTAVPNFIGALGLPSALSFALSIVWYIAGIVSIMLTFLK